MKTLLVFLSLFMLSNTAFADAQNCPVDLIYSGYDTVLDNPTTNKDLGWKKHIFARAKDFVFCYPFTATEGYTAFVFDSEQIYHDYLSSFITIFPEDFFTYNRFTGSSEFEYLRQEMFENNLITVHMRARTQVSSGGIDTHFGNRPERFFTPDFLEAIEHFPASTQDPDWFLKAKKFFEDYGTHHVLLIDFGALWTYESQFKPDDYLYLLSTGDLLRGLDASAEYVRTHGESAQYESVYDTQARILVDSYAQHQRSISRGAPPTHEAGGLEWFGTWNNAAELEPQAIRLQLIPISELLTSTYFPDDPSIDAKRLLMIEAYALYCSSVEYCHDVSNNLGTHK